jgi:hypothetical protein
MSDAFATLRDADMKPESLRVERYDAEILVELGRLEAAAAGFDKLAGAYALAGETRRARKISSRSPRSDSTSRHPR